MSIFGDINVHISFSLKVKLKYSREKKWDTWKGYSDTSLSF